MTQEGPLPRLQWVPEGKLEATDVETFLSNNPEFGKRVLPLGLTGDMTAERAAERINDVLLGALPRELLDDAAALADGWTWPVAEDGPHAGQPVTLAEANRAADRALYRMARDLGWRKLTLRERGKLGWTDGPQWRRQDDVLARLVELGHTASGASDWSRDEATGTVAPAVVVARRRMERDAAPERDDVGNV